jgi:hypothetical protein
MTPGVPALRETGESRGSAPRRAAILFVLVLASFVGALPPAARCAGPEADADSAAPADTTALPHRVLAYYFHTTKRCASCRKIEMYTTEAIQTAFGKDLAEGRLVYQVVNIEEKGNEHYVKDYELFTKAVVLVEERPEGPASWKNLPKVWELLHDKEKFIRYIQEETRAYLSGKES